MKAVTTVAVEIGRHVDECDGYRRGRRQIKVVKMGVIGEIVRAWIQREIDRIENSGFRQSRRGQSGNSSPAMGSSRAYRIPLKLHISI